MWLYFIYLVINCYHMSMSYDWICVLCFGVFYVYVTLGQNKLKVHVIINKKQQTPQIRLKKTK